MSLLNFMKTHPKVVKAFHLNSEDIARVVSIHSLGIMPMQKFALVHF